MLPDHRIRQRDYLLEITRSLTQELNLDILLQRILELAAEMLAGKAGLIALREEEGGVEYWRDIRYSANISEACQTDPG